MSNKNNPNLTEVIREIHDGVAKEMYCKGVDDFVKFASDMPTVEMEDGTIRPMWLEEIAEQLKGSASCVSDDVCEWELKNVCYTTSIKHYYSLPTSIVKTFNNCPYCGKKIKVVE